MDARDPLILVVDDEPVNVLVLQGVLRAGGFSTLAAASGQQARELAATLAPDLILLDIMMPVESGFETCSLLKQDMRTTDIPVIFISALADVENKVRGLELGAVDYITKPFEKAEVLARVRLHMKLKQAHKSLVDEQAAKLKQLTDAQQSMLMRPEELPEARFAIRYLPALEAGGDFYDVFPLRQNAHCYFIADICGHDLGASFVTSSLKTLVRQNSGPLYTPEETFKTMNSVLSTVVFGGRFLTAQALHLDRAAMQGVLVNAGHPPPILLPRGGVPRTLDTPGDILGVFPSVYLEPRRIVVSQGDRFFLYTDGLLERFTGARRSASQGEAHLLHCLRGLGELPLDECVEAVVRAMSPSGSPQEDDAMLMVVEA